MIEIDFFVFVLIMISISVCFFIGPFASQLQATTLLVGKIIAPEGMDEVAPTGFQDAITPKIQMHFNIIVPLSYLVILVGGSYLEWYLGFLIFVSVVIANAFIVYFMSKDVLRYLKIIIHYFDNKMADYVKDQDQIRYGAAKEVSNQLHDIAEIVMTCHSKIPSLEQIKALQLGDASILNNNS